MNPYKFFFAIEYCFFFFFSLPLQSLFFRSFFYCFCMLSKRYKHNFFKKTMKNKSEKNPLKMHYTQVSFGLKKHEIKYAVELDEFGWYNYITFYRRRSVFCRVWLNGKTFTHAHFLSHAKIFWTHATHATHASTLPTSPSQPRDLADSVRNNMETTLHMNEFKKPEKWRNITNIDWRIDY